MKAIQGCKDVSRGFTVTAVVIFIVIITQDQTPTFKFLVEVFILIFDFSLFYFQLLLSIPQGFYLSN